MGYSVYIKILAKCPLKTLIEENQKNFIDEVKKDVLFQKYLPHMREIYFDAIQDNSKFFKSIQELTMDEFQLSVTSESLTNIDVDLTNEEYEELEDYDMSNFVTCFFFEEILKMIDDNKIIDIFRDLEDIEFEDNKNCKLTIFSISSYKGSEELNIDYSKINNSINYLKSRIPCVKIITVLGNS